MKIIKISAMWCPSCIKMNKILKEIKNEFKEIEYKELDIDLDEEEVKALNIGKTLPEIIIYNDNNEEISRIVGEKTKEYISEIIQRGKYD